MSETPPTPACDEQRNRAGARRIRLALAAVLLGAALLAAGCGTGHPRAIAAGELAEAKLFPYYRIYWVGPSFENHPLAAVDGLRSYINTVGDSVYYGDCVQSKGIFGGGSCLLPLQVTTVIYRLHSNATLGPQSNIAVRGVPATVYDEGRSIEVYTGRVAVDIFSDTYAHALRAANELLPLNAPGSASGRLPAPVYCPGLSGPLDARLTHIVESLPAHICQRTAAAAALERNLTE
ncbi:MAG TPA: hypothetical protein VNZ01_09745 [Solirubrobacteraceae bacterium]|jgi:hypothetical protein|nr:hypothetical protein [Solirubrobacteraceae bacterium]